MTREDFIDILQKTLAASLNSSAVNENIRYYQDYIDIQLRTGQTEEEVLTNLGNPRLLAKTIIEAKKHEGRSSRGGDYSEYHNVYEEGEENSEQRQNRGGKGYHMPIWLIAIIVVFVLIFIIGIVGSVLSVFLPILIPFLCIVLLVKYFSKRR